MKSVMQEEKECYLCRKLFDICNKSFLEEHHIFSGVANRKISEKYGLKIYLCHNHHTEYPYGVHRNSENMRLIRQEAQKEFEKTHTREEFMSLFGKNYLE